MATYTHDYPSIQDPPEYHHQWRKDRLAKGWAMTSKERWSGYGRIKVHEISGFKLLEYVEPLANSSGFVIWDQTKDPHNLKPVGSRFLNATSILFKPAQLTFVQLLPIDPLDTGIWNSAQEAFEALAEATVSGNPQPFLHLLN